MFDRKLITGIAAAAALTVAAPAFASNLDVSHRTEATSPEVFAPMAENSWETMDGQSVDHRKARTDPSVFGEYRPDGWERTGDTDAGKLPYQRG